MFHTNLRKACVTSQNPKKEKTYVSFISLNVNGTGKVSL
jgi:hypothetical protein